MSWKPSPGKIPGKTGMVNFNVTVEITSVSMYNGTGGGGYADIKQIHRGFAYLHLCGYI